jgi:hypothetical protein
MQNAFSTFLQQWLILRVERNAFVWLTGQCEGMASERLFAAAFARVPRMIARAPLALSPAELAAATRLCDGFSPRDWTLDEAARALLLLARAELSGAEDFVRCFRRLRQNGDPCEQMALFRSLPLLRDAAGLEAEAAEGLRGNIPPVFAAIALDNPFPRDVFAEERWNQMILKALFLGCALDRIVGLDARANAPLAVMLRDLARERAAAGREIPHELWRCVAPFAQDALAAADWKPAGLCV